MLSRESNAGDRWKTTIGLIRKKATLHAQHALVLCISLPLFCTTTYTMWNFHKLHVFRRKCRTCSRSLLFHCRSFSHWWPLPFPLLSPPLQNFHVFLPTKKCLLCLFVCFLSLALDLSLPFVRWASLACLLLSLFLHLSLSLYFKFVDMTINLS